MEREVRALILVRRCVDTGSGGLGVKGGYFRPAGKLSRETQRPVVVSIAEDYQAALALSCSTSKDAPARCHNTAVESGGCHSAFSLPMWYSKSKRSARRS